MWLNQLRRRLGIGNRKSASVRRPQPGLRIEHLEDRLVPAFINVTSTLDNVAGFSTAGHAGTAADPLQAPSLRSAITYANATPGADTIQLATVGTYAITLAGTGDDANLNGDFDILAAGGDLTITNTSGGIVAVDGKLHDRVFDINPTFNFAAPSAKFLVTFEGFRIQHGLANAKDHAASSGGASATWATPASP